MKAKRQRPDTGRAQGMLFDGEKRQKQSRVDAAADEIKERFGTRGGTAEGQQSGTRREIQTKLTNDRKR